MKKIKFYVFSILFSILFIFTLVFVNNYFSKRVETYVSSKATVYASSYIATAIRQGVVNNIDTDNLYKINDSGIIINTNQVNNILSSVNNCLEEKIASLDATVLDLPIGIIMGEALFGSVGPNLKIRISTVGSYTCDCLTEVTEYGINNSLFKIYISVLIKIETIIPLKSGMCEVMCNIPVGMNVINGEVPRYYYNTGQIIPDVYDNNE